MIAHIVGRFCFCVLGCLSAAGIAHAQLAVPAGAAVALNGGTVNLGGVDLQIGGALSIGSGTLTNMRNLAIAAGGSLDGGSGAISLFGNWSNLGAFVHGSGTVSFVDGGTGQSNVIGSTTFNNVSFISTSGKIYSFAISSTQTIGNLLTILGTPALGIQFRSSTAGQVAFINLLAGGSQNIQYVGVSNVHASGQHLAPNQNNDGGSGDALGWFSGAGGSSVVAPTPMLTAWGLLLFALLLSASTAMRIAPRRN